MLSAWTLLAAAICAVPVSALSRRNIIHGRQLLLDLPERTTRLDFISADEKDHFTIWEHKTLSVWPSKPSKGQVNSVSQGWTFRINHVTFDDEGTYNLFNNFGAPISSYTVKVDSNREIIERVAGEKLTIPLQGLKQSDATLRFYSNSSSVTLVENGVPVGKNYPDYISRLKVSSDVIQVLNVNVSDLGRYELTDYKGRLVSNNTMILVDQHAHVPATGLLALLLLGLPCGVCICCRKRICNRCRSTKSHTPTVESNTLNTVPAYNTVINPAVPGGPGGPGQGYNAGYPPNPNQGQMNYPPPTEWSGQPAVSPNPGFHPEYVPQNPVYPPGVPPAQPPPFNAPPTQYNPSAPMNYTPMMYSAPPPGPQEPPSTAPLLTPQPEPHQSAMSSVPMDILNSGDSSVQFDINKGKSPGSNFL
ncbi:wu:fc21g02 [Pseudorasbora parva]|uniref:wu:fc21g02 n=1 Tax=Pseudorasbora parva TaxID=51549 RepID=UPI00351E00A1